MPDVVGTGLPGRVVVIVISSVVVRGWGGDWRYGQDGYDFIGEEQYSKPSQ
jgi:hypothetical protein